MKSRSVSFLLAFFFFLGLAVVPGFQETPNDLLQKALAKERTEGNLAEAIRLYQQIVDRFSKDRTLAATALIQIGKCYEKMGNEGARNAYDRVLRDFGDQAPQVAEARARLSSLESAAKSSPAGGRGEQNPAAVFRKINIPGQRASTHLVRLSPNGRKVLCVDELDKKPGYGLYIVDLSSGQKKMIVEGVRPQESIFFGWSPDGRKVVYEQAGALRVVGTDNGESKTFWTSSDPAIRVIVLDWSRDGRKILLGLENRGKGIAQMAILDPSSGDPRILLTGKSDEFDNYPQFSPDGNFIVGQRKKDGNTDIYVWSVEGDRETRLTDHPAVDSQPRWSHDGSYVVFMSNREKSEDLWAMPMRGAEPAGSPVRIKRNLGKNTRLADLTPGGTLTMFVYSEPMSDDLFALSLDPATGQLLGRFRPFAKYPVPFPMTGPAWSPDASRMAYLSRKGDIRLPGIFVSQGGEKEDEEIPIPQYYAANVQWSGNNLDLFFPGWNTADGRRGIFRVSTKDFKIEPVVLTAQITPDSPGAFVNLRYLPRAKRFSFDKLNKKNKVTSVFQMDLDGQNARLMTDKISADVWTWPAPNGKYIAYLEGRDFKLWSLDENRPLATLVQLPDGKAPEGPAWSPDGGRIAWKDKRQIKVLSIPENKYDLLVEAGENREIGGAPYVGGLAWSPDGKMIAYVTRDNSTGSKARWEVWCVPASGGVPRKMSDAPPSHSVLGGIAWHPGGGMILTQGKAADADSRTFELWTLENFLPEIQR